MPVPPISAATAPGCCGEAQATTKPAGAAGHPCCNEAAPAPAGGSSPAELRGDFA